MTENERLKQLRKALGLTLEEFSKPLGVGKSAISNIESGNRSITGQLMTALARSYNVDEQWLRTGAGEMFLPRSEAEELEALFSEILGKPLDDAERRMVSAYAKLTTEEREELARIIQKLGK